MAIIGKIREQSTLVLVIIGGAIMAFVLGDLFSSNSGGGQRGPMSLAEVNGTPVNPNEFEVEVQQAYETYALNTQAQGPLDEATKSNIREQVWNQKLSDLLIGKQMEDLGIEVTSKELLDMVQGKNPHPQVVQAFTDPSTGEFNRNAIIQYLQNLDNDPDGKKRWLVFERAIKRNQHFNKYNNLVNKSVYVPAELATKDYQDNNTNVSFKYIYRPFLSMNDTSVEVSDSDLKSYFDENKEDFEQEASTKVLYAYFPIAPSEKDFDNTRKYLEGIREQFSLSTDDSVFVNANSTQPFDPTYYSLNKAPFGADTSLWNKEIGSMTGVFNIESDFYVQKLTAKKMAPDSVQARHILVNVQDRPMESAEQLADSLMNELDNGADFEELAMTYSDDVGSGQKGGDLGWFTEGMMVKPFNDAAFATEVGNRVKVLSQFGYHIIEVTDKTEPINKAQIAIIKQTAEPGNETYETVFNQANSFSIEANDLESFNNLVVDKNIQRRSAVLNPKDNEINGLPASRDIVRWVRDAQEGEVSIPYDTDDAFVVTLVEQVNEKGVPALESVKGRVEYYAKQEKKAELFAADMEGATNLGELASKLDLSVQNAEGVNFSSANVPGVGLEPKVVGIAMSLEQGQMSVPIKGSNGVFVIQIDTKIAAGEANLASTRSSAERAVKARVDNGAILNALKEAAEITDNRSQFY